MNMETKNVKICLSVILTIIVFYSGIVDPINRFLVSGQLSVPILDLATGNTLKTA